MGASRAIASLISVLPFAGVRRMAYGLVPGYRLAPDARVGWLSVVAVSSLEMAAGSCIGRRTLLRGPMSVSLSRDASLGSECIVECGDWYEAQEDAAHPYERRFSMGDRSLTTAGHYFDAIGGIEVGEGTWIAGRGTQVWSHGLGAADRSVKLGRYCYVGSAVRFAPGSALGDLTVVGIGSVVTEDLSANCECLVAGVPAKVVRSPYRAERWCALTEALEAGHARYSS